MARTPTLASALGLAAALSLASPVHAAPLPAASVAPATATAVPLIEGFSSSAYDPDTETSEWRRCGWYGCYRRGWRRGGRHGHHGIGAGEVLAGAVIIGGIAAIANANRRPRTPEVVVVERDRPRDVDVVIVDSDPYPQNTYNYRYERERYEQERAYDASRQREYELDRELEELRRRTEEQQLEIEQLRQQSAAPQSLSGSPGTLAPLPPALPAPEARQSAGPIPVPDPLPAPAPVPLPRSSDGSIGLEGAVERCTEVIAIDDNVSDIDGAVRTRSGWSVRGRLAGGQEFTCRVNRKGQIEALNNGDFTNAAPRSIAPQRAEGQWSDDSYASARRTIRGQSFAQADTSQPLVPTSAARLPAYPGGLVSAQ
ncbi:MAG: hypothetical protein AAFQ90_05990 [Pseudomonadota bacterium]